MLNPQTSNSLFSGSPDHRNELALGTVLDGSQVNLVYESLLSQQQDAETSGDFEAYVAIAEKLQQLEEYEVQRLEQQARKLEAQVRIATAQRQLDQLNS
jgi:TolA-binding protein